MSSQYMKGISLCSKVSHTLSISPTEYRSMIVELMHLVCTTLRLSRLLGWSTPACSTEIGAARLSLMQAALPHFPGLVWV